jgi:hypothetical protein
VPPTGTGPSGPGRDSLPKRVTRSHFNDLAQPIWELHLNPDYGTIHDIPLLEALHGVGIIGAAVPIYSDRTIKLNIYVRVLPLILLLG